MTPLILMLTRLNGDLLGRALDRVWDTPKGNTTIGAMLDPARRGPFVPPEGSVVRGLAGNDGVIHGGYVVTPDGELQTLWATVRDTGSTLVSDAIAHGARRLDCFDGFLPSFYRRHGFVEVRREPNWTPGGPDVVFMELR